MGPPRRPSPSLRGASRPPNEGCGLEAVHATWGDGDCGVCAEFARMPAPEAPLLLLAMLVVVGEGNGEEDVVDTCAPCLACQMPLVGTLTPGMWDTPFFWFGSGRKGVQTTSQDNTIFYPGFGCSEAKPYVLHV